ncbi:FAD-dependent oxidoreductase [Paenibacillus sp. M1]|uniref:FAD-dependent oxidoreductase n=1 Tax=Paenibacillus haidiansis TaxID=1574488 RepID=A0ABU7VTF1_9BACL
MRKRKHSRYVFLLLIMALILQAPGILPAAKAAPAAKASASGVLHYDVVVIGSELQGVLLAKSARDLGLDVLILDPRSKPGGELIQGQMIVLDEPNDNKGRSLVQGALKPLYADYKAGKVRKLASFEKFYQKLIQGIPLKSGVVIEAVDIVGEGADKTVKSLTYRNRLGTEFTVEAEYWVENTDFNALTGKLGEKRIPGMESIYNGQKPDYMAATYMLNFKNVNWGKLHQAVLDDYPLTNVRKKYGANTYVDWNFAAGFSNITFKYKPQDTQFMLRGLNATYQNDGEVAINALLVYDVDPSDPKSVENAVRKGKAEAPHVLKYLQKNIPGFEKAQLGGLPEYLYIRDYNRYETKYVLDYPDLMSSRMFWDNVTIGGYPVDLQATRIVTKGVGYGKPDRYGIPLRSFMLKSYDNVLVAGKNVGATIKAYGSARIVPTTALAGQTIGIILGRELKQGKRLDELTPADFRRIHQYLEKDYKIAVSR